MKKLIGVAAILFTLLISIIYRQLTARPAKDRPAKACIRAKNCVRSGWREGMMLSRLLLQ
ncbi:MAG TPA: hypothetical protein VGQ51_14565 [Puia sp.]|nr:hypothetical protein [Puia sp.]